MGKLDRSHQERLQLLNDVQVVFVRNAEGFEIRLNDHHRNVGLCLNDDWSEKPRAVEFSMTAAPLVLMLS